MMSSAHSSSSQDSNSHMALDSKRNKYWWTLIGGVVSTLLLRSSEKTRERFHSFFRTSVAPLLGPSPDKSTWPVSSMCDDGTPVEIGWVFKPTGEMSVQFAIEVLSPIDGSPIAPQQNLIILQVLAIAGECHDFDLSWSRRCTQSLTYLSKLLPQNLKQVSQFFIGIDLSRPNMVLKAYFLPSVRSKMTGVPAMDILTRMIGDLGMALPWSKATTYFSALHWLSLLLRNDPRKLFPDPQDLHPRRSLLGERRPCNSGDVAIVGSGYCNDVQSLFHITLAAKKGGCQVTSYINPEAFSQRF